MTLTAEHLQIASVLDQATKRIISRGGDDVTILRDMVGYMDGFKRLMDTTTPEEMNELCARFDGFINMPGFLRLSQEALLAVTSTSLEKTGDCYPEF